ncbi:hypothetical protein ElyMa_000772200 [Elysia marginata]|uniref:Uncharacterized protein n=1 Tax=Elysia marginata TaxID=1093978 RepID=A0AAV4GRW9_9GAST|nr:hypothetical protein ElyMa_000772200 [Elysia marginata]
MGNSSSRFSHGLRDAMRACSGKRRRRGIDEDDEARLSTYESEPLDRAWTAPGECGGHERAVSVSRTGSRASSLARLHDGKIDPGVPCGRLASVSPRLGHRGSPRIQPSNFHQYYQQQQQYPYNTDPHSGVSYQPLNHGSNFTGAAVSLSPCCCRKSRAWVVDQGSQTSAGRGSPNQDHLADEEPMPRIVEPVLSKEYIVKTYSIQNATPSPSPSTQTKFASPDADTPPGPRTRLPHVPEWTPSPPSTLQINFICSIECSTVFLYTSLALWPSDKDTRSEIGRLFYYTDSEPQQLSSTVTVVVVVVVESLVPYPIAPAARLLRRPTAGHTLGWGCYRRGCWPGARATRPHLQLLAPTAARS